MMRPDRYLKYFVPAVLFGTHRTKQILHVNPTAPPERKDAEKNMSSSRSKRLFYSEKMDVLPGSILTACASQT